MGQRLVQDVRWEIDYRVRVSEPWSRFLRGLRNRELWANRCDACTRVYVPPQPFCESCLEPVTCWSRVAGQGTLRAATIARLGLPGGPPAPYAVGAIQLDGTDSLLIHHLGGVDLTAPERLLPGRRVSVVWNDERTGSILDIRHFAVEPS